MRRGIRGCELQGRPVCIHASLRSFGRVEGGPDAVVDAFLDEGCTVLVPSHSWSFLAEPPPGMRLPRNGWDYERARRLPGGRRVYRPDCDDVDPEMGAVARAVLARLARRRGDHPLASFAAVGPRAETMVGCQSGRDSLAPLQALADAGGAVALIGVGLERMTLLHLAERHAGRRLFRRWADDVHGTPSEVEVGGCSEGFPALAPVLEPLARRTRVGQSQWTVFPAAAAVAAAAEAIRGDPRITHCGRSACRRCDDAVAGGPPQFSA